MNVVKKVNDYTGLTELIIPAVINNVSNKVLKNTKDTEYRIAGVTATMPDGSTQKASCAIWEKLHESNEYAKGDEIMLAIQLEGEYAGYSKIYLEGASRFDVSAFVADAGVKVNAQA